MFSPQKTFCICLSGHLRHPSNRPISEGWKVDNHRLYLWDHICYSSHSCCGRRGTPPSHHLLGWQTQSQSEKEEKGQTRMIKDPNAPEDQSTCRSHTCQQLQAMCPGKKGKCTFCWKFASSHLGDGVGGILQITRKVCPSNNTCHRLRRRKIQRADCDDNYCSSDLWASIHHY